MQQFMADVLSHVEVQRYNWMHKKHNTTSPRRNNQPGWHTPMQYEYQIGKHNSQRNSNGLSHVGLQKMQLDRQEPRQLQHCNATSDTQTQLMSLTIALE
jgi:hypothetical protein